MNSETNILLFLFWFMFPSVLSYFVNDYIGGVAVSEREGAGLCNQFRFHEWLRAEAVSGLASSSLPAAKFCLNRRHP